MALQISGDDGKQHENMKRALVTIMRLSMVGPVAWLVFLLWFVSLDGNTPVPSEMGIMIMLCFYGGLLVTFVSLIVLGVSLVWYAVLWLSDRQTLEQLGEFDGLTSRLCMNP